MRGDKSARILLLGEFSSVHATLKSGLHELGYENVTLASNGDYWRNIPNDVDFVAPFRGLATKVPQVRPILEAYSMLMTTLYAGRVKGYDVVQMINPFVINYRLWGFELAMRLLIKNNRSVFFLAAGDDAFFWKKARYRLNYGPFDDFLEYDKKGKEYHLNSHQAMCANALVLDLVRLVIPVMYEYQQSYFGCNKVAPVVPLPINTDKIKYHPNLVSKRLVVFHGLTRYGFKGTRHVELAFERLRKKYPNDLELRIEGNLPFSEYVDLLKRTNVVIDQTNSYSLGVNGLMSMAMGKVVLGGVEPESLDALGVTSSPAINIKPDADDIVKNIEGLLERKSAIEEVGYRSRCFIEDTHDYIQVSKQYIDCWSL